MRYSWKNPKKKKRKQEEKEKTTEHQFVLGITVAEAILCTYPSVAVHLLILIQNTDGVIFRE